MSRYVHHIMVARAVVAWWLLRRIQAIEGRVADIADRWLWETGQ